MSSIKRKAAAQIAGSDPKKAKQNTSITSFFGAPKPMSTAASAGSQPASSPPAASETAAKFDKAKWVAGLTSEQRDLLKLEIDTLDESWLAQLKAELVTSEFLDLKRFLNKEASAGKKIFPPREDIYSWCDLPSSDMSDVLPPTPTNRLIGLVTLHSTTSRSSSSVRILITTTTRPMVWHSPSGHLLPPHHH